MEKSMEMRVTSEACLSSSFCRWRPFCLFVHPDGSNDQQAALRRTTVAKKEVKIEVKMEVEREVKERLKTEVAMCQSASSAKAMEATEEEKERRRAAEEKKEDNLRLKQEKKKLRRKAQRERERAEREEFRIRYEAKLLAEAEKKAADKKRRAEEKRIADLRKEEKRVADEQRRAEEKQRADEACSRLADLPGELQVYILHHLSLKQLEQLQLAAPLLRRVLQAREPSSAHQLAAATWLARVRRHEDRALLEGLARRAALLPACEVPRPSLYEHACRPLCPWFAPEGGWEATYARNPEQHYAQGYYSEEEEEEDEEGTVYSDEYDQDNWVNDFPYGYHEPGGYGGYGGGGGYGGYGYHASIVEFGHGYHSGGD